MNLVTPSQFRDILESKFGKVKPGNDGWFRLACPTCNAKDAKKFKRYIRAGNVYSNCFICEEKLLIDDLLGQKIQIERHADDVEVEDTHEHPQSRILPCINAIPINQLEKSHPAVQLLAKDSINDLDSIWNKFRVVYVPEEGADLVKFESGAEVSTADSLLFPVIFGGELVGWQCRFIPGTKHGDKMQKMRYFHVYPKGRYLYNYDRAKGSDFVVLMEGVKKVWKYDTASVASLGKSITDKQLQLLQEWKTIILFLDGEEETQKKTKELQDRLWANSRFCLNIDPRIYGVKSPDEMSFDQVHQIIQESLELAR